MIRCLADLSVMIVCACGKVNGIGFDCKARPYSRTLQCPDCGQIVEIRRPIVLDLGKVDRIGKRPIPAAGDSPKGESR